MKIKKNHSIAKLKQKFHNIFTIKEQIENNNSIDLKTNLRIFSPIKKKKNPILDNKNLKNSNETNNSNVLQNSTSNRTLNTNNNPTFLSKTTSTTNLFNNNNIISSYILKSNILKNKKNNYSHKIEYSTEIPLSQKITFIQNITNKLISKTPRNNNSKKLKTKYEYLFNNDNNKLNEKEEKMINGILFDRIKTRNLRNKNANGELCDDIKSKVNLEPFINSYGKILYNSIKKSDFIINIINAIYPKITKTHYLIKNMNEKKNDMIKEHSLISSFPIYNNKIFKINPIKRSLSVFSKYPDNFNKCNYSHFFYRSKSKQILHNDFTIFKYHDKIL